MTINSLKPTSIVFIDGSLPHLQAILSGLDRLATTIVLDPAQDGIRQMADALAGMSCLNTIYVISHGSNGQTNLGSVKLTQGSLAQYQNQLATMGIAQALSPTGDLLLFCGFVLYKMVRAKEITLAKTHHEMATV